MEWATRFGEFWETRLNAVFGPPPPHYGMGGAKKIPLVAVEQPPRPGKTHSEVGSDFFHVVCG